MSHHKERKEQSTCIHNMANVHLTVTNTPPHPKNRITKKIKTAFNKACDLKQQHSHTFLNLEAGLQGKKKKNPSLTPLTLA